MKLLIIKSECRLSNDGIKKYEDEFNRMIRENGYLILPYCFKTEVVEVDCLDATASDTQPIRFSPVGCITLERRQND